MAFLNAVVVAGVVASLLPQAMARSRTGLQDVQRQRPFTRIEASPSSSSSSSSSSSPFTDNLTWYVNEVMDEWKVPGLAIAVIDGGHVHTEVHMLVRY